jgi:hypothetical protein
VAVAQEPGHVPMQSEKDPHLLDVRLARMEPQDLGAVTTDQIGWAVIRPDREVHGHTFPSCRWT